MKQNKNKRIKDPVKKESEYPGYSVYPSNEDIYIQNEETDVNPDNPTEMKTSNEDPDSMNEKNDLLTGDDLDVPGSELDDNKEEIGSEDEENNYYSISDNS